MPLFPATFTLLDAYARKTTRSFLLDALDFATAQTGLAAFAVSYQNVTMCQLIESRLYDQEYYAGAPSGGANVDEGATFSVLLDTPGKKAAVQVPAIIEAARNPDGSIDLADVSVAAYIAHYTSGFVTASDGETVTSFVSGQLDK